MVDISNKIIKFVNQIGAMMKKQVNDIFSRRLRQARLMKGFSLEKLSQVVTPAVTRQAINKYEKGLMMPDSRVLIALAAALGVKIDYFFRPFTVEVEHVEFRKKPRFPERMAAAVREKVREELERYLEVEQICGCPTDFSMPRKIVRTVAEAAAHADELRKYLSLGNDGVSNVIEVLEEYGVKVIEIAEDKDFDGLSGYANGSIPLIVINGNFVTERKRFTALHELGHLLLDIPADVPSRDVENICNAFASEFLLPMNVLKAKVGNSRHDISLPELTDIQCQFGISVDDIMLALQAGGVITPNRYSGYQAKKKRLPDFKVLAEKSRAVAERSGRFVRMVYRALADESITYSKAAALLNTSVESVRSHLQLV